MGGQQAVAEGWGNKLASGFLVSGGSGLMAAGAELFFRAWLSMGKPDLTTMTADGNYDGHIVLGLTTMLVLCGALSLFAGAVNFKNELQSDAENELRRDAEKAQRGQKGVAEAEYQGRNVPLGKPMAGDVKKSKVYVRKPNGKVVKVNFGDKKMRIKKSNPKRRKSFRARHHCENPGPRWKARYWSCRAW